MIFREIKPYIRHVEILKQKDCFTEEAVAAYDHIMIYNIKGSAEITINEESYPLEEGDLLLIKPGSFFVYTDCEHPELIQIHFDYTRNDSIENGVYLPPEPENHFDSGRVRNDVVIQDEPCFQHTLFLNNLHNCAEHFKNIAMEFRQCEKYYDLSINSYFTLILISIIQKVKQQTISASNSSEDLTEQILQYIHANYHTGINNTAIARQFGVSAKHINVLVKKATGYSPHQYIMMRRISKSIDLLQNTDMTIYEIAEALGFSDSCHFTKCFKQVLKQPPKNYRMKGK